MNSNYQDFLGLGRSLRNGDEKVEEVRVGLLGFRKEVEAVRKVVGERDEEVQKLVKERERIRKGIAVGRNLVEYEQRLKSLEEWLLVETAGKPTVGVNEDEVSDSEEEEEEEDDDEDEEGRYSMSLPKLKKHVLQYRLIQEIGKGVGEQHPFIVAQAPRLTKVRNTILLDLSTALQQAKAAGSSGTRVVKIMKIYADMDESTEAVKVLKSLKAK